MSKMKLRNQKISDINYIPTKKLFASDIPNLLNGNRFDRRLAKRLEKICSKNKGAVNE
jgi:hypothetical protein